MKRLLAVAFAVCIVGSTLAQSSFTIVRPADGSKVREKIRVLIPKNSIKDNAYVGVFLNGHFVEAVVPPVDGNYRVYTLDTKVPRETLPEWRNGIPDGDMKLELVQYEGGDTPRIVDRSSVNVTVANHMNVAIPAGGIKLRYAFRPGEQFVYKVFEEETMWTLNGVGNDNGGRPAQFPTNQLAYRVLYAVDNTYSGGDSLVRMQHLPDKGRSWALLTLEGTPEPQQVFDWQMEPVYMRVGPTGRARFGSVPPYFGFEGTGASGEGTSVYGIIPLPVLPEKAVAPGSSWGALYEMPSVIAGAAGVHELSQVTAPFPARGEFVDAEWEMGHPCAKIRNSIAQGTSSAAGKKLQEQGRAFADDKVSLDETIYFALDTHKILKVVRSITIDRKMQIDAGGTAGGAGGGGILPGGRAGAGTPGTGGATAPPGSGGSDFVIRDRQKGRGGPPSVRGGGGQAGSGEATPPGLGGGAMGQAGGRTGGGAGAARTQYIRIRSQSTMILEQ